MAAETSWLVERLTADDPTIRDRAAYEAGINRALEATRLIVERLASLGRAPGRDLWERARHVSDELRMLADELDTSAEDLPERRDSDIAGWRALTDLAAHIRLTADGLDEIVASGQEQGPGQRPRPSVESTTALADWLAAYTLGGAHSERDPEVVVRTLVEMSGTDELVLDLARVRFAHVEEVEPEVRKRTVRLLASAARSARSLHEHPAVQEPRSRPDDLRDAD